MIVEPLIAVAVVAAVLWWVAVRVQRAADERRRAQELERRRQEQARRHREEVAARKNAQKQRQRRLAERGRFNRDGLPSRWARPVRAARSAARDYDKAVSELIASQSDSAGLATRLAESRSHVRCLVERVERVVLAARALELQHRRLKEAHTDSGLVTASADQVAQAKDAVDEWVRRLEAAAVAAGQASLTVELALPAGDAVANVDQQALAVAQALAEVLPLQQIGRESGSSE